MRSITLDRVTSPCPFPSCRRPKSWVSWRDPLNCRWKDGRVSEVEASWKGGGRPWTWTFRRFRNGSPLASSESSRPWRVSSTSSSRQNEMTRPSPSFPVKKSSVFDKWFGTQRSVHTFDEIPRRFNSFATASATESFATVVSPIATSAASLVSPFFCILTFMASS